VPIREHNDRDLEELAATLRGSLDDYNFDPRQLDRVESRLDLLYRLKKAILEEDDPQAEELGDQLQYYTGA